MPALYLGRIVAVGLTPGQQPAVMYRVSSRSFPNRRAILSDRGAAILPKPGHEGDALVNPYIAYACARLVVDPRDGREVAVLSNGSHTDPVAEKIALGYGIRDAFAAVLTAMDYEKDAYDTPRIVAAISLADAKAGWLGVVRRDGLDVRRFALRPGECFHVSTYEHAILRDGHPAPMPDWADAEDGCRLALSATEGPFANFSNPVTSVCALAGPEGFTLACREADGTNVC